MSSSPSSLPQEKLNADNMEAIVEIALLAVVPTVGPPPEPLRDYQVIDTCAPYNPTVLLNIEQARDVVTNTLWNNRCAQHRVSPAGRQHAERNPKEQQPTSPR